LCLLLSGGLIYILSDLNFSNRGLKLSKPAQTTQGRKNERKEATEQKDIVVASGFDQIEPGKHARYDQPGEAIEFFRRKRLPEGATELPIDRYFAAIEAMRGMPQYSSADGLSLPSRAQMKNIAAPEQLGAWTPLGPGNIGGRTRALLIHPTNPSTMYAAGVAGGVWRTTDGGASWAPLADLIANIAVNSLAMDPSNPNVIYAGTGEGYFNGDGVRGAGIFKTTDGGTSWTRLAGTTTTDFHYVNDIVVSPANSQRVYAATRAGVWRSLDGGANWTRALTTSVMGGCTDLAARTDQTTDYLFAACGNFQQATVFRNTNAAVSGPWTAVLIDPGMGRTSLAIAPSNQNIVYALSASVTPGPYEDGLHAVFRSTSSGDLNSWTAQVRNTNATKLNTTLLSNPYVAFYGDCGFTPFGPNLLFNQGWYDNVIAVDPADPNRVWAGGIDLFRSDDGGASWGLASYWWANGGVAPLAPQYAHADHHVLVFHPQYNGTTNRTLFTGNDGGIFRTTDARAPVATSGAAACNPAAAGVVWTSLNNNYGVTQFYHGAPYPNGASYFGGTQDNGTLRGSDGGGANSWNEILGGDGGYVAVDPTNTNILYAANTGISIRKSTDGGANFVRATDGIGDGGLFISPFAMDPSDPRRLWTGGIYLWRTTNGAASWTRASALTAGLGAVSAIAVAPTNANFLLAGMSDGFILRTNIGLTSTSTTAWPNVQPRTGYVSWVAFDPTNKDIAYATYSTFGGTHVWRSINGGASWTGIDGTGAGALPDIPVHCLVVDPLNTARLYLGTDLGVFVSTNGGASWAVENTGFANVVVESLGLNVVNGVTTLYAFTHGRGAWKVTANQTGCLFALSPAGQFFTGAGGAGTINVTAAPAGCNWTATSDSPWITINTGGSGSGNGAVGFTVAANTTTSGRTGTITAAGRAFTVTQQGCAAIAPTFQHFEAAGGQGAITVTAAAGCSWTVSNSNSWITINSGGSGSGNGAVNFTVAANTGSVSRAATFTVGGQAFTVTQAGAAGACASAPITAGQSLNGALTTNDCRSLGRGSAYLADRYTFNGQAGQQIVIGMSAPRFDTYLYLLDAAGSIVAQGNSGGGGVNETDSRIPETGSFFTLPGTGVYAIETTSFGANRTGDYTVSLSAGAANCSYAIAPASQSFGINGGAGSVNVTAGGGCAWQAVPQAPWITVSSGASGSGNGAVGFTVAPNNTIGPRTGAIIAAGQVFTITQGGQPALYRGEWRGTTSAGLPVRFQVDANDVLIYLEVDVRVSFSFGTCAYTLVSTDIASIENGQFAVPLASTGPLVFSNTPFARGTLTSSGASGRIDDLQVFLAICGSNLFLGSAFASGPTWNAQRQVICHTATNIAPTSGTVGTAVTITGANFTGVTGVKFGSAAAAFTVNSDTEITAVVPGGAATGPLTISKAGCNDVQTASFTVNPSPVPSLAGVSPTSALVGGGAVTLTVNGSSFINGSIVRWNGADRQTAFVNATQLTATIPASDLAAAGTANVTVFNPAPGGGASSAAVFTINNPAPTITNIAPTSGATGAGALSLTVNGAGFVGASRVRWNGAERATTLVNGTQLTAQIPASDLASGGVASVTVFNPSPGGGVSNAINFTVNNPTPTASLISPNSAIAGGPAFTLNVTGANFVNGSVVRWNGSDRATTTVSPTQLTAAITAADIATAGAANITVFNPAPGGGVSGALTFTTNNPVPALSQLNPNPAIAGSGDFTLNLTGTNFVNGSMVRWNGANRPTNFVNNTRLTAAITAADIGAAGAASVTVFNPTPGGGLSNPVTLNINNPVPTISGLNPNSTLVSGSGFALNVTGANFINGSAMRWNGSPRPTTFVSNTQLTAAITDADIATAGAVEVTVFNPTPGGGTSNVSTFTINNPVPTITQLSPNSTLIGGPAFTLNVTGTNFITSSVVRWNGSDRATTRVSATLLRAAITAADIATAGAANVTVFNPGPGGGVSNTSTFTVIGVPDLAIAKTHTGNFTVGAAGVYTLRVTNNGSGATTGNITVTDALPNGLSFRSFDGAGWNCTAVGQMVTCANAGPLAVGASSSFTLTVGVASAAVPSVTNAASVATTGDSNSANNSASDPTTVVCDFAVAPLNQSFTSAGGQGSVTVATETGCAWTAVSNATWITVNTGASGIGNGTVTFTVAANTAAAGRTGALTVAGKTVNVTQAALVSVVSAASFRAGEMAAESIVSAFGSNLATTTLVAPGLPLPTELAGTTVKVRDSAGTERLCSLFFVAPSQINFLVAAGTANGAATVTITSGSGAVSTAVIRIATVAPTLFSANSDGQGPAAGVALRVINGAQTFEPIAEFNAAQNRFVTKPIDLDAGGEVFLILFGSGLRFRSSLSAVTCAIGGLSQEVLYAGASSDLIGMDQLNLRLSRNLIGRGEMEVALTVDGKAANVVRINVK
jgi:uncharacterized protein (TIGR03437 family)